jgi:outer membrane protein assembly factor BamA
MLAALALAALLGTQPPAPSGTIAAVRVQGNVVTSDDEVIRLSGIRVGDAFDAGALPAAKRALESSGRFQHVEVLQRYASLSDPTALLIVIIVDEGPVKVTGSGANQRIARARGNLLFMPVVGYEEGYGLTYGARFADANPIGSGSRLSFPLTWGGDKRAGAELDKTLAHGPFSRARAAFSVSRRTNPFFDADDDRVQFSMRGERTLWTHVNAGVEAGVEHVSFQGAGDRLLTAAADVTVDTRVDPMLARNAVYGRAAWQRVSTGAGGAANRTSLEGRGYVGLIGQAVLVGRVLRESSDRALPSYLQPLLGGMDTLRGFRAGYRAGDVLFATSAELRVPLTSPLGIAKFGVRGFVDAGTTYDAGVRLRDQRLDRGVGGGIWFAVAALHLNLDVAHGIGASTHVHFGTTLGF